MKRDRGFTLIELLVVIAIIAILAAILFPAFATAKEKGRVTTCCANLKNLSMACKTYADDNSGRLPMSYAYGYPGQTQKDWCGWYAPADAKGVDPARSAIWPYCGRNKKIFICPTDVGVKATSPNMRVNRGFANCEVSYAMNYLLGFWNPVVADTVRNSTTVLLLIHEGRDQIDDGCFCWGAGNRSLNLPTRIHYNGSTLSYLDGHVRWASYDTLVAQMDRCDWTPK